MEILRSYSGWKNNRAGHLLEADFVTPITHCSNESEDDSASMYPDTTITVDGGAAGLPIHSARLRPLRESSGRTYNLHLTVRFRPAGETAWRDGTTENVSRSGVLFHASRPLDANTPVELRLALPIGHSPDAFSEVICSGRIVRTIAPSSGEARTGIAVAISHYELVPGNHDLIES